MDFEGHLSLLGAFLVLAALLTPLATAAALRISLE
jgi:ABC-type transport system involved in cytochrome c biogenesis permease component